MVVPQIIHFERFSIINHTFWGTTIFGNTQIDKSKTLRWQSREELQRSSWSIAFRQDLVQKGRAGRAQSNLLKFRYHRFDRSLTLFDMFLDDTLLAILSSRKLILSSVQCCRTLGVNAVPCVGCSRLGFFGASCHLLLRFSDETWFESVCFKFQKITSD